MPVGCAAFWRQTDHNIEGPLEQPNRRTFGNRDLAIIFGLEGNLLGLVASYRIPIYRMALKNARRGILKSVEKPKWRSSRTPSFKGLNYTISVNENTCLRPNARGIKLKFRVFILEP